MENTMTLGEKTKTRYIDLSKIDLPENARPHTPDKIASLAADMKKEGQLQEIVVTPQGDRYEVVAGVGRMLAARQLKWSAIRCFVKDGLSDFEKLHVTYSENEEREDVSPIYQAQLLSAMMKAESCSQRELAGEIDKTEAYVSQYLSLLSFSPEVLKNLTRVKFSLKQLLEIRKLEGDEAQLKAASEIEAGSLTVKETIMAVQKHLEANGKGTGKSTKQPVPPPVFGAGGQSFTFTRKGERFTIVTEPPSMDLLNVYVQNIRCALIDYMKAQRKYHAA